MSQNPRAVVAGASGFIGHALVRDLRERGYDVACIGRNGPDARWHQPTAIRCLLDGAELLVNLAGKSVACRYHDRNRREIYRSRIETTRQLRAAVAACTSAPPVWINASTATIYRHAMDHEQTESGGELGTGFSVDVARDWEETFFDGDLPGTRRVALRTAIVLGSGGALGMLGMAARFGLGGTQYDGRWPGHNRYRGIGPGATPAPAAGQPSGGRQRVSWVHVNDVLRAIAFIAAEPQLRGPVNVVAPAVTDNRTFMAEVRHSVRAPFGLPAPRWLLEIGMIVLRQETELILKSRWVAPEKLLQAGFEFRQDQLDQALQEPAAGAIRS